jgi:hypothetical protein
MPGSPTATLKGHAMPASGFHFWDHAYADSSCGFKWGCFGRDSGGSTISSGNGDSTIADCLSFPRALPVVYAGIIYGRTGVCHQAANRILHPAKVDVSSARGFPLSLAAWGMFGKGTWPELSTCYPRPVPPIPGGPDIARSGGLPTPPPVQDTADETGASKGLWPLLEKVAGMQKEQDAIELTALIEAKLGKQLDKQTFGRLLNEQRKFRRDQDELARQLENGKLDRFQYLELFNELLRRMIAHNREILGTANFHMMYGEAGDHPEGLVDPDVFLASPPEGQLSH